MVCVWRGWGGVGVGRGHTVSGGREGRWCEVEATGGHRRAAEKGRWWRVVRWRLGLGGILLVGA